MAHVSVQNLKKVFGGKNGTTAVDDVSLELEEGELLVLLGPSGCGKTTTLRCIAGLESPDEGSISIGSSVVFSSADRVDLPPEKRDIGMVFQAYGLWPHMTVRKNLRYPLKARRSRKHADLGWVEETARMVDCSELLDRLPGQLSGGQQQRVALGRGLVARPDVVLFDEPLSNLDARLRDQVRNELHRLHNDPGFTAVFVTHDQDEALALADRIAVMRSGRIEQVDTPERLFNQPASEYVADFMGMTNRIELDRGPDGVSVRSEADEPATIVARVRPENMRVRDAASSSGDVVSFPATLETVQFGGLVIDVMLSTDSGTLICKVPNTSDSSWLFDLKAGHQVVAEFAIEAASLFDADTGSSITGEVTAVR